MKIGVLALQGAFREQCAAFDALGVESVELRSVDQLAGLDAVVLPGGESTAITKLLDGAGLWEPLADRTPRWNARLRDLRGTDSHGR